MTTELQFTRLKTGEYWCDLPRGGSYHVNRTGSKWVLTFYPSYRQIVPLGAYKTYTEAKIAAADHERDLATDDFDGDMAEMRRLADEIFAAATNLCGEDVAAILGMPGLEVP